MSTDALQDTDEPRTSWRPELIVLAVALVVRAVHFAGIAGDPLVELPRVDPRYHDEWARRILGGELLSSQPFFRAPLYPYLLAGFYALTGGSILLTKAVQLALGAWIPVCTCRLGRMVAGDRIGFVAGMVVAVYPLNLRFDGDLLLEGTFVALTLTALWLLHRAARAPSALRLIVAGTIFGLAAITRPNILGFLVLLPVLWIWQCGRQSVVRRMALLALGVVLPIVPVSLHNLHAGDFVPIATQAGVNFHIGNNAQSDGFTAVVPGTRATWWGGHDDAVELAREGAGRPLTPSEVSDYWLAEGLRWWRNEPLDAARLLLRKTYLFFWGAEISNNEHIYFQRRYSLPMRLSLGKLGAYVPFGIVAPLALFGLAVAWRSHPRSRILVGYVLAYAATVILFFVCARFRYPVVPVLVLFAVIGVVHLWRDRRLLRRWSLPLVGLAVLLNADPFGIEPAVFGSQALSLIDLGAHHANQGEDDEAIAVLREAIEADPGHPGSYAWMGSVLLRQRRHAEAEPMLQAATRGDATLFRDIVVVAWKDLGRLYLETGRPQQAGGAFQSALDLYPDYVHALIGLGYVARDVQRPDMAVHYFGRALELEPGHSVAERELARLRATAPPGGADE